MGVLEEAVLEPWEEQEMAGRARSPLRRPEKGLRAALGQPPGWWWANWERPEADGHWSGSTTDSVWLCREHPQPDPVGSTSPGGSPYSLSPASGCTSGSAPGKLVPGLCRQQQGTRRELQELLLKLGFH